MSINKVIVTGNLGAEPEIRMTPGGTSVMSFNIAVNDRVKDRNGNWTDRPNWIRCALFGGRADALASILHKGSKVAIQGRLRQESWEQNGQRRSSVSVTVEEIDLMTRETRADVAAQAPSSAQAASIYDEDVPF